MVSCDDCDRLQREYDYKTKVVTHLATQSHLAKGREAKLDAGLKTQQALKDMEDAARKLDEHHKTHESRLS